MPPVSIKKDGGPKAIQKDVEFVAKDADEQVATGIVMVPDKVDLQNDFVREDQIREFAEQFENFESVGEASGGIMHAVFPDEWLDLERNEVLDESEEIGGTEAPAGAWVQSWQYNNDDLWQLVDDGTFAGYSVGIDGVRWDGPYEQDDVEDVDVPEEIDEDELVWEIVEGIMREVSTVDIPAVPDAEILEAKTAAGVQKRLADHLGNRDAFIEEAQDRGHDEEAAERMWDVLNEAAELEGAGQPGEKSVFERIGKAVFDALPGASDGGPDALQRSHISETPDEDPRGQTDKDATGGGTPADDGGDSDVDATADSDSTDMTNDNPDDDGDSSAKELAEQNAEQINELTESVKELTDALKGPQPKTAEIEVDGETYEIPESEVKAAFGVDDDTDVADAIKELEEKVDTAHQRLDAVNRQSGGSTQVDAAAADAGNDEDEEGGALDKIGAALS